MPASHEGSGVSGHRGPVRAPQGIAGGILLIALAALALWLTRDLDQGTLNAMGPAMLPRWLAIGVGLSGLALIAFAFIRDGEPLERWSLRGPFFVILAILAFAVTIRPFSLGSLTIPGLGVLVAGPLAIILGGYATNEARFRDLLILALSLTPFCMVLFGDLLNLPIPIFPQAMASLFPADWSQKAIMRLMAAVLVVAALVVFFTTRGSRKTAIDVADHSGRI
ncbi:tripartite tricarboxylate transporter TctB family protein [Microvirga sp. ACRRW]|uniref:tripartite tricarboxylate transporter TctB family protein n=1 Tax=Microvirga sp. ACRRW TaxID=2918205 RepID=UPI001EF436DA|nr:tripartite tricarboxylate transporter TctB family protein [Microvirga sp. ACRRW]MCG7392179.1 tripartite tricarboxylate transporter TctB family protein [Microvirga sp. ACRRW]